MEEMIKKLLEVRMAIQNLEKLPPTEHNCNQILASIQRIDSVVAKLREEVTE